MVYETLSFNTVFTRALHNPYPEPNQPNPHIDVYFFKVHSNVLLKGLLPVGCPLKILQALLPSFILVTWPAHVSLLDLINLIILGER